MNRKILAVFIVAPMVVFASDKILNIKHNTIYIQANQQIEEIHSNAIINDEEMVTEMKISIKDMKGREKAFSASNYVSLWSAYIKDDERKFIQANVIKKLEAKNICKIDLKHSFSRCPSGYDAVVISRDKVVTNEGWIICRSGCDQDPITKFRYDVKAGAVECKISDKAGYVSIDEYCKLYKTALASM